MNHYTLNTGDRFPLAEKDFDPAAVAAAGALFPKGGPIPRFPAFRVACGSMADAACMAGAASFCIWRGLEPLALCVVCWDPFTSAEAWKLLRAAWPAVMPPIPALSAPQTPWLGALLLPSIAFQSRSNLGWMADFEQCLALAIWRRFQPGTD